MYSSTALPEPLPKRTIVLPRTAQKIYQNLLNCLNLKKTDDLTTIAAKKIDPFSLNSLFNGRPTDTALVVLAGYTGAGKSSLINAIFEDPNLCATSKYRSETSDPILITKPLQVDCKDFGVQGNLAFVDVPGSGDTNSKQNVTNFAKIKHFLKNAAMLAPRTKLNEFLSEARATVFPNIVLFVINGKDNRLDGDNANLAKSLKLLLEAKSLLDMRKPNLIIAVTHACSIGIKKAKFVREWTALVEVIRKVVSSVLGNFPVDIVAVENCGDDEDYELEKVEGYYKLPDGTLSHYNLIKSMLELFDRNQDETGKLLVSAYLNPNCAERSTKPNVTTHVATLNSDELREAEVEIQKLEGIIRNTVPSYHFQGLGYGYDPVTEEIKPANLLKLFSQAAQYDMKEVSISDSKFMIPGCITPYLKPASSFYQMSYASKQEYEKHKASSYGIGANVKLVVDVAAESKWLMDSQSNFKTDLFSLSYEQQVATFKLEDIKSHINNAHFKEAFDSLPSTFSGETTDIFLKFFTEWGTHIIYEEAIGGFVQFDVRVAESFMQQKSSTSVSASLNAVYNIMSTVGTKVNASDKLRELESKGVAGVLIRFEGGETPEYVQFESVTEEVLQKWSKTVPKRPCELRRSIKLCPYHSLLPYGEKYKALRLATERYLGGATERRGAEEHEMPILSRENISKENTSNRSWDYYFGRFSEMYIRSVMFPSNLLVLLLLKVANLVMPDHFDTSRFWNENLL